MDQPRRALVDLLRPRLKPPAFNEHGFLERFDAILDAGGMRRDAVVAPAPLLVPKPNTAPVSTWQAMIDLPLFRLAFPTNSAAALAGWVEPTRLACVRWGIDLPREIASFLGNISVESQDLKQLTENLNYSVEALIAKFGRHRISVAEARRYGRIDGKQKANQEALANILYGGEFGRAQLGNIHPTDGWDCRGFGPKQVTGRSNQQRFADAMGMTLEQAQAFMRTPEGGMMAAGWFWLDKNMDAKAATPGWRDDRVAVNGGTFGLSDVEIAADRILHELLRRERAAA
jgi:putative chitinase